MTRIVPSTVRLGSSPHDRDFSLFSLKPSVAITEKHTGYALRELLEIVIETMLVLECNPCR